jgi:hypothetical protein
MLLKSALLAFGSAACSFTMFYVTQAEAVAYELRQHASACAARGFSKDFAISFNTGVANSRDSTIDLDCPVPDNSDMPATAISSINVHGHDPNTGSGSANPSVGAVVTFFGSHGGQVVSTRGPTTNSGDYVVTFPSPFSTVGSGDFKWLRVTLPAAVGTSRATLRGIFYFKP